MRAEEIAKAVINAAEQIPAKRIVIAIDGRCASGKTTLAKMICERTNWDVVHMDDFFLRPEQRTAERLAEPGSNVDWERFREEILVPLEGGCSTIKFRSFDCRTQRLSEPISVSVGDVCIIEGSYSCHPELRGFYGLRVFLTVNPEEQMRRILLRNGTERAEQFAEKWIPLEEEYFAKCDVERFCELKFNTD
ncbi:MAG: uridine kinase [Oscillospiraceae bacterium]|nr:uridine kinase [Oscillospiraceae bacterium]